MKIRDVTETPLVDIEPVGDFDKPGGFRSQYDKRIVTNPIVHQRAKQFFSRSPHDFRIYPINVPGGSKHLETGEVSMEWLEQNLPKAAAVLNDKPLKEGEIVIFFTNNTGTDKVPLTPWMMAHRIGHVLRVKRTDAWKVLETELTTWIQETMLYVYRRAIQSFDIYSSPEAGALFSAIGTMRSARTTKRYKRPYEFVYELFAQYINSGEIKFNELPEELQFGRQVRRVSGSTLDYVEYNNQLDTLGRTLEYYFSSILTDAENKIFVM